MNKVGGTAMLTARVLCHFTGTCLGAGPLQVHQASLSLGVSRQEYWSGLPFPPPRDLPSLRMEPGSPVSPELQVDSLLSEPPRNPSNLSGPVLSAQAAMRKCHQWDRLNKH